MIGHEVFLDHPDFDALFETHTGSSKLHISVVISQRVNLVIFYSQKMNSAKQNYTTTEKELILKFVSLKEFRNIQLGHQITVYTDHKNLTHKKINTESIMRWRLILKEFGPELKYIKFQNNVVANALSHLDKSDNQ